MSEEKKNIPVVRIAIDNVIGEKKKLGFETYLDAATPLKMMHSTVDKLMSVADRQITKYELVDLRRYLDQHLNTLRALQDNLATHDSIVQPKNIEGRRRPLEPSPKQQADRNNMLATIAKQKEDIQRIKDDITKREAALASLEEGGSVT
jgi:hypothetical protein